MERVGRASAFTKSCRGTRTEKLRSTRGSTEFLVGAGSLRRVAGSEAAVVTQHVRSGASVSAVFDEVNKIAPPRSGLAIDSLMRKNLVIERALRRGQSLYETSRSLGSLLPKQSG
jgi:hypothetical protein